MGFNSQPIVYFAPRDVVADAAAPNHDVAANVENLVESMLGAGFRVDQKAGEKKRRRYRRTGGRVIFALDFFAFQFFGAGISLDGGI
jgi:hypothetical protein